MKTTIDIPDALFRQAKIRAAERGVTLKTLLVEALERGVAGAGVVEESPTVYAAVKAAKSRKSSVPGGVTARTTPEYLGFTVDKYGVPVINRRPGDKTVITNEMINRIREEEGI